MFIGISIVIFMFKLIFSCYIFVFIYSDSMFFSKGENFIHVAHVVGEEEGVVVEIVELLVVDGCLNCITGPS